MTAKANPEIVRQLSHVPILSPLKPEMLDAIAADAKERHFAAGERLVTKGDQGIALFLILDGTVEVRSGSTTAATLGPGQFFGEMALLQNQPRTADVVAKTGGRCLVVAAWEFWGTLSKEPEVIRLLFQETVRRLRSASPGLSE